MIELVADRMLDILKEYLPAKLQNQRDFWGNSDIEKYGAKIDILDVRDDTGGSSYFIGEPMKVADFPAIMVIPQGEEFSENVNVAKYSHQYSEYYLLVRAFNRTSKSEKPVRVEKGLLRLVSSIISVLREYPFLESENEPKILTKSMGISKINYYPYIITDQFYLKAAEFLIEYKISDKIHSLADNYVKEEE